MPFFKKSRMSLKMRQGKEGSASEKKWRWNKTSSGSIQQTSQTCKHRCKLQYGSRGSGMADIILIGYCSC